MPIDKYRHSKYHNMFDFSNYYFKALDGMEIKNVEQYAKAEEPPLRGNLPTVHRGREYFYHAEPSDSIFR